MESMIHPKSVKEQVESLHEEFRREAKAADRRLVFNQVVLIFVIGCIFGTYYEQILTLVKTFWATGMLKWVSRRGLVYGPFSPVYGIGAVGVYLLFYRTKAKRSTCLIIGAVAGGMLEYALSLLQEWLFHTRSWDYTGRILEIGGRTTVPYMVFWGTLVYLACYVVFPWFERFYRKVEGKTLDILCVILAVFLAFDIMVSCAATMRQAERRTGAAPSGHVEVYLDEHFPDERLKLIYDNAVYIKE